MAADPTHLERMGRELKCPICLSLLDCSVSLNCNHVFCNSCIMKSMKSGSNCPVCKVPYRPREVRPVPHMDNLVSIYRSMEISSGTNIFISQNVSSTKLSDGKNGVDDCKNINEELRLKAERNVDQNSFESVQVRPSFPGQKRVQVPQSESKGVVDQAVDKLSENRLNNLRPFVVEKGEPVLSPFFWLRDDENVENLSQDTGKSPFNDLPLMDPPTFSDIKDSDDENSSRLTPDRGEIGKSSNCADMFDSEMFEWTQRPCSPELCSSPFKTKVADVGVVQVEGPKEPKHDNEIGNGKSAGNIRSRNKISPAGPISLDDQVCGTNPKKRSRKASKPVRTKSPVENANLPPQIVVESDKRSQDMIKPWACKRGKKVHLSAAAATATKPTTEHVDAVPVGFESSKDAHENAMPELPGSLGKRKRQNDNLTSKRVEKTSKKTCARNKKEHPASTKKAPKASESNPGEASKGKTKASVDPIAQLSALFVPLANEENGSESGDKGITPSRYSKSSDGFRSKRKTRLSCCSNSKDVIAHDTEAGFVKSLNANEDKKTENNPKTMDTGSLSDPLIVKRSPSLTNGGVLKRCENSLHKMECAFCLSSEESEVSGEMLHYHNGRPVASDYDGGSKVIHAHKNCTEWAPNVYFEDDFAINLEAELIRSRRIKCSCCGIKGAALGCYDKGCRKSFHVPCAKLMPQCRWDTVNFVMLCPLHPSLNFPSKRSESQARKNKCDTKKSSPVQQNRVVKHDLCASSSWSSCGSSKKIVLCCSALTSSEREIVSEFERISGVIVAKKWESNVTHVIASTDENGACKRTLKVLMGILDGKWILSIKWIIACMEAMKQVNEEHFEITVDTHGIRDGPQLGRLRVQNQLPKLFDGFKFYVMGDFVPSYKGYLQDLVTAAGGTILHRKPVSGYHNDKSLYSSTHETFIIYSLELPDQCEPAKRNQIFNRRRLDAETLASSSGAKAVSNSWVLNSIAACKLQSLTE